MSDSAHIGKYEIRATLGHGGMGTVYQGFDPLIGRLVAIKTIRRNLVDADIDGGFLERFRNEARAAGRLNHPNIVGIYEYGEDATVAFIAMEFVDGVDLARYTSQPCALGADQCIALLSQLLAALDYAHRAGVVHRDIKPSNLMITPDGTVKVADFGIARIGAGHLTAPGTAMGTLAYMSPEQCRGVAVDNRSDLFSAGVVLYEVLTGRKPFDGQADALVYKICHDQPAPPSRVAPAVHAAFDGILATALAKDAARRYQSASEFRAALHEAARMAGLAAPSYESARVPMETRRESDASAAPLRGNLPRALDAFIGRERELADIARMLRAFRLLTIVGAGGLGKTRLALEAAYHAGANFADGAWVVELAPISDPRLVVETVASVLGVKGEPDKPLRDSLMNHAREREILLLLDNCEHLGRAPADLALELLRACPRLTILTTSREPLRVNGEATYALSPLAVPDPRAAMPLSALRSIPSMRLFVERATAAQSSFTLNERNSQAVADICLRLDGIPLALELAAARVRSLPVETIDARLDDRFRLLKGGDHTALPRQQTLGAMIDWSHDLLTERQRTVFRRAAVFAGDFSLEAAEEIVSGGSVALDDVLDVIVELVEKSLISLDPEHMRYRLLQTIRHYAMAKAQQAGETQETRERHVAYYLALAEEADPKLLGTEQAPWTARLDAERENLMAAHAYCGSTPALAQAGLRLVHALRVWLRRGSIEGARNMGIEALAREGARERTPARGQALFTTGSFCYFAGRYDEVDRYAQECLDIAREHADLPKICDALAMMGVSSLARGDTPATFDHLEQALTLARGIDDPTRLHQALNCLAEAESATGNLGAALRHYEEAMTVARSIGAADTIVLTLFNLARVRIDCGLVDEAAALLREALVHVRERAGDAEIQQFVTVAAGLASSVSDWHQAARLFGLSEALYARAGARREPADETFLAPLVARAREALGEAAFAASAAAGGTLPMAEGVTDTIAWLSGETITIDARCNTASRPQPR